MSLTISGFSLKVPSAQSSDLSNLEKPKDELHFYSFNLNSTSLKSEIRFRDQTIKSKDFKFTNTDKIWLVYKISKNSSAGSFEVLLKIKEFFKFFPSDQSISSSDDKQVSLRSLLAQNPEDLNSNLFLHLNLLDYKDSHIENAQWEGFENGFLESLKGHSLNPLQMSKEPWNFVKNFPFGLTGKAEETSGGKIASSLITKREFTNLNSESNSQSSDEFPFLSYNIQNEGSSSIKVGFQDQIKIVNSDLRSEQPNTLNILLEIENLGELSYAGSLKGMFP